MAVAVVLEAAMVFHQPVRATLLPQPEWGMAEIMRQGNGLRQILVQSSRRAMRLRDGGHLHRVRQPGAQVSPVLLRKTWGFVFQPAEGAEWITRSRSR